MRFILLSPYSGQFGAEYVLGFLISSVLHLVCLIAFFIYFMVNLCSNKRKDFSRFRTSSFALFIMNNVYIYRYVYITGDYHSFKYYFDTGEIFTFETYAFIPIFLLFIVWLFKRKQKLL